MAAMSGLTAGSESTLTAMGVLRSMMPSAKTDRALDALKGLRDKWLAHPEHIALEGIPKTTWAPADKLLRTGQLMVGALDSLTSTVYLDNAGSYLLTGDARRASVSTHRLLRKLKIAPPVPYDSD